MFADARVFEGQLGHSLCLSHSLWSEARDWSDCGRQRGPSEGARSGSTGPITGFVPLPSLTSSYFTTKTLESSPEAVVTVSMARPFRLPLGTVRGDLSITFEFECGGITGTEGE